MENQNENANTTLVSINPAGLDSLIQIQVYSNTTLVSINRFAIALCNFFWCNSNTTLVSINQNYK